MPKARQGSLDAPGRFRNRSSLPVFVFFGIRIKTLLRRQCDASFKTDLFNPAGVAQRPDAEYNFSDDLLLCNTTYRGIPAVH